MCPPPPLSPVQAPKKGGRDVAIRAAAHHAKRALRLRAAGVEGVADPFAVHRKRQRARKQAKRAGGEGGGAERDSATAKKKRTGSGARPKANAKSKSRHIRRR